MLTATNPERALRIFNSLPEDGALVCITCIMGVVTEQTFFIKNGYAPIAKFFGVEMFPSKDKVDFEEVQEPSLIIQEGVQDTIKFFEYQHLPEHLQEVSKTFYELAHIMVSCYPHNREMLKALDKLVESKDCAVRANLAK